MLFRLPNPIQGAIEARKGMGSGGERKYEGWRLVPAYGEEFKYGRAVLGLLDTLGEVSPTYRVVMRDLKQLAFGNMVRGKRRTVAGLRLDAEESVGDEEALRWAMGLGELGLDLVKVIELSQVLKEHLTLNGNAYLRVMRSREGGVVRYGLGVVHFLHVTYGENEKGQRVLVVSQWLDDEEEMKKVGALLFVPSYKDGVLNWNKIGGVEQALIHLKSGDKVGVSGLYDRSPVLGILPQMYTDYQMGVLSSKIAGTDLVSKKILAFEGPDPNLMPEGDDPGQMQELSSRGDIGVSGREGDYFKRNMILLRELTTNLGRHPAVIEGGGQSGSSLAAIEYPFGSKPPTAIDLEINRDTAYHTFQVDRAGAVIAAELGWALELTSVKQAKATLGGNLLHDMFVLKNETTIKPMQLWYENLWLWLLDSLLSEVGRVNELGVKFENVIDEIVERFGSGGGMVESSGLNSEIENEENDEDAFITE